MQPHLEDLREPSVGRQKPEFPLKPKLEMSALQKWNPFRGSSLWVPNREVEKILNRMASVLGRNHRMFRPLLVIAFTLQLAGASAAADSVSDFATGLQFPVKLLLTDQGNLLVSEAGPAPNTGRISIVNRHGVRRSLMEGLASGGHASADGSPLGSAGLVLRGRILYVCNGDGGLIVPGVVASYKQAGTTKASAGKLKHF
jgi:hypothetical protein